MIGGMYLGDIVRRVILRMSQESDIFGPISSILSTPFVLRYISVVFSSASASNGNKKTAKILLRFLYKLSRILNAKHLR